MKHHINRQILACLIILTAVLLVSCSGGGSAGRLGTLELSLIDSPSPYQAIYVTINQVRVHHEIDGWKTLSDLNLDLPRTINLLDLVNGAMSYLGSAELAAGHYNQMRLILEHSEGTPPSGDSNILGNPHPFYNYLIDSEDNEIFLKVPSGGNTGIKLVNGFDIEFSGATELVLDFDALKSVVQAGNSGKWLLKPTIKVVETVTNSVSGMVVDADNDSGLEGAVVSAQKYSPDPPDAADRVVTEAGTVSDEQGNYFMYLPLLSPTDDPYNIIVAMTGYAPACQQLSSNQTGGYTADFALTALNEGQTGTLSASVNGLTTENDSALFSIRQTHSECGVIEVASVSVANTIDLLVPITSDPITLPAGTYQAVVSAEGWETKVIDVEVNAGQDYLIDVEF
jgi:hypothetical protein